MLQKSQNVFFSARAGMIFFRDPRSPRWPGYRSTTGYAIKENFLSEQIFDLGPRKKIILFCHKKFKKQLKMRELTTGTPNGVAMLAPVCQAASLVGQDHSLQISDLRHTLAVQNVTNN